MYKNISQKPFSNLVLQETNMYTQQAISHQFQTDRPGLRVTKLFSCSTQLSMKLNFLKNDKMAN